MFKLKKLQDEKAAKEKEEREKAETAKKAAEVAKKPADSSNPASPSAATSSDENPFKLSKKKSSELAEVRKKKSQENVLSLKAGKGPRGKAQAKVSAAELRAQKDIAELVSPEGITYQFPEPNNIMHYILSIKPKDGLYKGAEFKFIVVISPTYPYDPPKVSCETLVYHPNIDFEGHVCLNILRADWTPALNLNAVNFGLMTLFLEPNPDDPLNKEAAKLMIEQRSEFDSNVKKSLRGGYVAGRQFPCLLK